MDDIRNLAAADDEVLNATIRPQSLTDFVGQTKLLDNLKIFISAAKKRGSQMDHVLFYGPPGLGKTTLANIIAKEMGVNIRTTSGPMLMKRGDLAAILTNLQKGDVLCTNSHVMMYIGGGKIMEAAYEDDNVRINYVRELKEYDRIY